MNVGELEITLKCDTSQLDAAEERLLKLQGPTIAQARELKDQLEKDLCDRVKEFEEATGATVARLNVKRLGFYGDEEEPRECELHYIGVTCEF